MAKKVLQQKPLLYNAWLTLGLAQLKTGRPDEARDSIQKSMDLTSGGSSVHWFGMAMVEWHQNEKLKAKQWYDKAVEQMDISDQRWALKAVIGSNLLTQESIEFLEGILDGVAAGPSGKLVFDMSTGEMHLECGCGVTHRIAEISPDKHLDIENRVPDRNTKLGDRESPKMADLCPDCGKVLGRDSSVCGYCGHKKQQEGDNE